MTKSESSHMMQRSQTEIGAILRRTLTESLHIEVPPDGAGLISRGLIDSLALVELLMAIESEFGIRPDFHLLEIEDFETLGSIEQFIIKSQASTDISRSGQTVSRDMS